MASKPTRIPGKVHDEVQAVARVLGRSPGELLEQAWASYRESPEFRDEFAQVQKAFSGGDLESITSMLTDRAHTRARARVAAIQDLRRD